MITNNVLKLNLVRPQYLTGVGYVSCVVYTTYRDEYSIIINSDSPCIANRVVNTTDSTLISLINCLTDHNDYILKGVIADILDELYLPSIIGKVSYALRNGG